VAQNMLNRPMEGRWWHVRVVLLLLPWFRVYNVLHLFRHRTREVLLINRMVGAVCLTEIPTNQTNHPTKQVGVVASVSVVVAVVVCVLVGSILVGAASDP